MTLIPRGPKELKCPLWKKSMALVCHTCPLWTQLRGVDPQTGNDISDEWNCSLGHLPRLLVENSQQSRQTGAAVESLRNKVDDFTNTFRQALGFAPKSNGKMIEGNEASG